MANSSDNFAPEERTYQFALKVRQRIHKYKWQKQHWGDIDQILRTSDSVGANYIETNNSLSKKDFCYRIKTSKKEPDEPMRILATILSNSLSKN